MSQYIIFVFLLLSLLCALTTLLTPNIILKLCFCIPNTFVRLHVLWKHELYTNCFFQLQCPYITVFLSILFSPTTFSPLPISPSIDNIDIDDDIDRYNNTCLNCRGSLICWLFFSNLTNR